MDARHKFIIETVSTLFHLIHVEQIAIDHESNVCDGSP